jgi:hypothetical protein
MGDKVGDKVGDKMGDKMGDKVSRAKMILDQGPYYGRQSGRQAARR